ncbi:ABC transporter ATP-binding protein [Candidimonas humi]|uniref:ABC transporter ATP-binding protein n=1 Tax=Candidimonas humi TaxID=683355 RepID=A0ABV8NZT4_9BURK|nr:ABC transporter ATP-binding protein [Candidimonas humi]MBV6304509.1 ABC transporter ATP-binding protein [Candidimonas humi]
MARDNILLVDSVHKSYGGRVALNGASLEVAKSSITGVIGPNGSGKSTLFNIVAGSLRPDAGHILLNGRDVSQASPADICRQGVGRTFQISRLFSELTVLENLVAIAHGLSDHEAVERAMGLLEFLEITGLRDKWGRELSYGQCKLVEIARALMLQPTVMLLDEPFAGINPRLQNRIVDHLQGLRERGLTLFFIDHEMRIVLGICDELYVLAEGQVIANGDPAEIRASQAVREAYF